MKFIATDGTVFHNRNDYRKYEMETQYTFREKNNVTLTKHPGSISGQPFNIIQCNKSTLSIFDHCDQVQIDNVSNSKIFIGASSESIFLRDCSDCIFTLACKQLRTRDCHNCCIYLHCKTEPIIETSSQMKFGQLHSGIYPGHDICMTNAGLNPSVNKWYAVYDFNDEFKMNHNWSYVNEGEEAWCPELLGKEEKREEPMFQDEKALDTNPSTFTSLSSKITTTVTLKDDVPLQLNENTTSNDDEAIEADVSLNDGSTTTTFFEWSQSFESSYLFIHAVKSNYCHFLVQIRKLIMNSFYCVSRWIHFISNSISKSLVSWTNNFKIWRTKMQG